MHRIAIVTDAWHPQINGVVTTLTQTVRELEKVGHAVKMITPQLFRSLPCPTYPEIRLAFTGKERLRRELCSFGPDAVHIATEGPLGWTARAVCRTRKFPFTSSYHTRFPEYIRLRAPVPLCLSYGVIRVFHQAAARTMVATSALARELAARGLNRTVPWSRGVDTELFRPDRRRLSQPDRPVMVYVGRVAVEKNIEAFLRIERPGTKIIIGDGPARADLEKTYPEARFVGYQQGAALAGYIADADVMVFPSRTDTFGVVMLEAMACGVPVAAFPVTGPATVVTNGVNGWLDDDLTTAVTRALTVPRSSCRQSAMTYSWEKCSAQFLRNLEIAPHPLH